VARHLSQNLEAPLDRLGARLPTCVEEKPTVCASPPLKQLHYKARTTS